LHLLFDSLGKAFKYLKPFFHKVAVVWCKFVATFFVTLANYRYNFYYNSAHFRDVIEMPPSCHIQFMYLSVFLSWWSALSHFCCLLGD